ncbi:MAG TPA: AAA family ATPase [Thermoanaerobaculia bacterium]|jgi:DNA repair exonuclease SbcCD ATPase subunit
MRLHRLRVRSFAALPDIAIDFGPGLNVLYGPNDLGKSTLAGAIRLALLLPHASKGCEPYVPWAGGDDPYVELTFETEAQRIWRVRKQFGPRGSSFLDESRNGQDYEEIERARRVDARLREILRWGIPEPGGTGAGKGGLPPSFLATALLSTQADVTDILGRSLHDDGTESGKEQIAAALQAVAQDPLFLALLRQTQARRDEAYTDRGAKKTARGSVFKVAADRVNEAREEVERLQKTADESQEVERHLEDLYEERRRCDEELAIAEERLAAVQLLARQVIDRAQAEEAVETARAEMSRIQDMDRAVIDAEQRVRDLAALKEQAEQKVKEAQATAGSAGEALAAAEEKAGALGSNMADTVARQELKLRKIVAEQAVQTARQRVEAAVRAREQVEAAGRAEEEHRQQEAEAVRARERWAEATRAEKAASDALSGCDRLERGVDARNAERQVEGARAAVDRESALQDDLARVSAERSTLAERRAAIVVPPATSLPALRRLENDLASARGALDVGLVMTVIPTAMVDLRVRKDGVAAEPGLIAQPLEIEADTEVEVDVADLATVRVRGGRREAQDKVRALESRRDAELLPHLTAAGVADLEALEAMMIEARDLDSRLQSLDAELESLRRQITDLAGAAEGLREASARAEACRAELDEDTLETLAADLDRLGQDPGATLRARRQQAASQAEKARADVQESATTQARAEERARTSRESLETAVAAREQVLSQFPDGLEAGAMGADEALQAALAEQGRVTADLASLQAQIEARKGEIDKALAQARERVEETLRSVETVREALAKAIADHASEKGTLVERRRQREALDLAAAERGFQEALERHAALPVPERPVSAEEVTAATDAATRARQVHAALNEEILTTQGKLQQVGGAVARDRLREATDALEIAERQERELEVDYEAWKLLLEQMKAADADQASNLGQAIAPTLAGRFQALTRQRYKSLQFTAQLKMEGILVAGGVRPPERISVGTREQLSTLYRLCLGEYLQTTIVLDDQLVQSDDTRMEWFRGMLAEKARSFQIVVFTCRPSDYLRPEAMVAEDGVVYADSDEGFVRAIDLGRVVVGR